MMNRGPVQAAVLAVVLTASVPVAAQEARETERIARLIRELGAPGFADRQQASQELARLGAASREQLEAATSADDPEIRARAMHLLRGLKIDALWQASLIDLQCEEQPVEPLLKAIAEQSGNHVATGTRYEAFNDRPLSFDLERGAYWQTLDEICRQSGNHFRPHYDVREPGVVLIAGRPGMNPVAYSGPLRVELISCRRLYDDELSYKNMDLKRVHSFKLSLQVLWEDRLQLTAYRATPRVSAAVTDDRRQLLGVEPIDTWNVVGAGARQLSLDVKLQSPSLGSRRLECLLLEWTLLAVGDHAEMAVDDLSAGKSVRQDGLEVVIESCAAKSETLHELVLTTTYDELLPDPPESVFHENSYRLRDGQGRAWSLVDQSHDLRGDLVRSKLTFRRDSGDSNSPPVSLQVRYPRVRSQRDLQIQFRDVSLPPPIDAAN